MGDIISYTKIKEQKEEELTKLFTKCKNNPLFFAQCFNTAPRVLSSKQREFLIALSKDEHIVMMWSRQTGKSTSMAMAAVWWLLWGENERIYVFAPTEDQSIEIYDKIARILMKFEFFNKYMKFCSSKQIVMYNGNFCKFMSASPGSHIRGKTATRLIIDETGDVTNDKYDGDIMPFLSAVQYNKDSSPHAKTIIEAGTPRSKNHFFQTLSKKGVKVIKQKWYDCEFIDKDFVLGRKAKAPQALFEQEYLCKFLEEGSTCFPTKWFHARKYNDDKKLLNGGENRFSCGLSDIDIIDDDICFNDSNDLIGFKEKIKTLVKNDAVFTMGFDNGRQVDNAALCIWRVDSFPCKLVYNKSFPLGTTEPTIVNEMKILYDLFQPYEVNIDWTNEKGFEDFLRGAGIPAIKSKNYKYGLIVFKTDNKIAMVSNTQALLQKGLIRLPKSEEILYQQFTQQQFEIVNGKYKYYHPTNSHDDQLWATLLALKNIQFEIEDTKNLGIANIWKKHNEIIGFEEDRYSEFRTTGRKKFSKKRLGVKKYRKKRRKKLKNR